MTDKYDLADILKSPENIQRFLQYMFKTKDLTQIQNIYTNDNLMEVKLAKNKQEWVFSFNIGKNLIEDLDEFFKRFRFNLVLTERKDNLCVNK